MATFIPVGQTGDYHGSEGEMMVYEAFKKLPDDYIVFYSVKWGEEGFDRKYRKGEADFLVFDPSRGFLVIEVKTSGIKRTEDGRWFVIDRNGKEHQLVYSPLDQAWRSVDRFQDMLASSPNDIIRKYPVIPTVWFPSLTSYELSNTLPSEYQLANTFSEADLDLVEAAVNRAFSRNNVTKIDQTISKTIIKETVDVFAPAFKLVPSLSSEIRERNFLFNQLTREQATLLDYLGEQKIAGIHGPSGSGKTMIALECARKLPADENILFLCFNRLLLNYLIENYASEMPNVTFTSLNRLYAKSKGTEIATEEQITDFLLDEYMDNFEFRHIIIDEAQDFAADHLDILIDAIKATDGYFYVFYDRNQLVHYLSNKDESTLDWLKKLDCRLVLHKNCRNTYEIAQAAYAAVDIDKVELAERVNGDKPCLNNYNNINRAIDGIAETIRFYTSKGFKRNQITILTVKTLNKSILSGRESVGGYRLSVDGDGDGILFTTARKYKGLESDIVIMIDIDRDVFSDDKAKCVFYVASSRAKHCLTYISVLDEGDMAKMIEDLGSRPSDNPSKDLADLLNIQVSEIE